MRIREVGLGSIGLSAVIGGVLGFTPLFPWCRAKPAAPPLPPKPPVA